jgi:dTDP-4-amino-4,6-dideoxygalactose transaminase
MALVAATLMNVSFNDLRRVNARFAIGDTIARVLRSGYYLYGAEVEAFEREFAEYVGTTHCVALANGLDALRLCLRAWISLGRLALGDEVLVPANSFFASALAATESGLSVRFIDVSPVTFNVTAETVGAVITDRSRALIPVHLYGQLADIERIQSLCRTANILMLEDSAQAHGARAASGCAGAFGDAGAFSFYPTKNLGALGDAGCIVTNDGALAARVRALANYGSSRKNHHEFFGANSRMDEIQAAILRLKLGTLDGDNDRRRAIARRYREAIRNPLVDVPAESAHSRAHVWHIFAVTTTFRESLSLYLAGRDIQTSVHYPCAIHQQPAYLSPFDRPSVPISERLQHEVLSLPISPAMKSEEVDYVIETVNAWPGPK